MPDKAYMGAQVTFSDTSSKSTKWEWHFEDDPKVGGTTKSLTHIFKTSGTKKVTLIINDRVDLTQTKYISIIDKDAENAANTAGTDRKPKHEKPKIIEVPSGPTAPPLANPTNPTPVQDNTQKKEEEKPIQKAPEMTVALMQSMLLELSAGTKQIEDFSPYLCGNLSIPVVYNSSNISFTAMCNTIKQIKKKKIKSIKVSMIRPHSQTNCVETMVVNLETNGFIKTLFK
jgi:hypothetical protein